MNSPYKPWKYSRRRASLKSFLGMWSKDGKREETGKGEMAKLLPKLAFTKCFYGPGAKHTGCSFKPDSILKEEYCLLVYYLVPPSLLECKLLGSGDCLFCSPLCSNVR